MYLLFNQQPIKMRIKYLLILMFLMVIGCKDKSINTQNENQNQGYSADLFKVTLRAVVKKDDDFCLLYTEDKSLNFVDGVWKNVEGSDNEETIEFLLPSGVFPTQIRLDLGKNIEQEDILIKSIKFEYSGKTREIKGPEIGVFFRADDSKCSYDSSTGILKAFIKNDKKLASLYPNEIILDSELPKLAK
jgi:hypothetical protein